MAAEEVEVVVLGSYCKITVKSKNMVRARSIFRNQACKEDR